MNLRYLWMVAALAVAVLAGFVQHASAAAPVAQDDSYSIDQGFTLNTGAPGVLANDSDPDGDALDSFLVPGSGPAHGTLTVFSQGGQLVYDADPGFVGIDTFQYYVTDWQTDSAPATVSIEVLATNNPPVAADDSYTMNEDDTLVISSPGLLANDSDADGDSLTASYFAMPSYGDLVMVNYGDGSFSYKPYSGFYGTDVFTYRAVDQSDYSAVTTVTITVNHVNHAPVAIDASISNTSGATTTGGAGWLLNNSTDFDYDSLTSELVDQASHGTATVAPDGSFSYASDAGYAGDDAFTFRFFDGTDYSNVATFTVHVIGAPIPADDDYSTPRNQTLVVDAAHGVLANDVDPAGTSLSLQLDQTVGHGTLALNSDGSFTYTPETGFQGVDAFYYSPTNGKNFGAPAEVALTVGGCPVEVEDTYSTTRGHSLAIDAVSGVLANDSDPDGDPLTAALKSNPVNGGFATVNLDGSFSYVPPAGFVGADVFKYTVSDGVCYRNGQVTITIDAPLSNTAPTAIDMSYDVNQDTTLDVSSADGLLSGAFDADGDQLTAVWYGAATWHGVPNLNDDGSFRYVPDAGFSGDDTFQFYVADSTQAYSPIRTVTIHVHPTGSGGTGTATATPTPSATLQPSPSSTPPVVASPSPTNTPSETPTTIPSETATATPTETVTATPTETTSDDPESTPPSSEEDSGDPTSASVDSPETERFDESDPSLAIQLPNTGNAPQNNGSPELAWLLIIALGVAPFAYAIRRRRTER